MGQESTTFAHDIITELVSTHTNLNLDTDIIVYNDNFYDVVLSHDSLGLGESYILGWWDEGSRSLDELFYEITKVDLKNKLIESSFLPKFTQNITILYNYFFLNNSIENSKIVALQHYDLDIQLYETMLGNTMTYSCGYFLNSHESLDNAQYNKLELVKRKLNVKTGMRILDIGSGWGTLAAYLGDYHAHVDGITISREQFMYARKKFQNEYVKFYLEDYREFKPSYQYDAIISVGMFEHVGSKNYEEFMKIVDNLLKPQGIFLLHTIGVTKSAIVPDRWIDKYIFPNYQLPSLEQIIQSSKNYFVVEDVHNFGSNYDKTLMCWHNNFVTNFDKLNKKLYKPLTNEFYRMWTYYLLSCAGSFRSRQLQLYQVVMVKNPILAYNRPTLENASIII